RTPAADQISVKKVLDTERMFCYTHVSPINRTYVSYRSFTMIAGRAETRLPMHVGVPKAPRLEKEEPAMAVRSQEMHTTVRAGSPSSRTRIMFPAISLHSVAYIVTALLALLAIYAIMGNVMGWGRARYDDLRYGTTRTFQADEVVGHDDGAGT